MSTIIFPSVVRCLVLLLTICIFVFPAVASEAPSMEALRLVLETQKAQIEKYDSTNAFPADSSEHVWIVKASADGNVDGKIAFTVIYKIGSKTMACWNVNTLYKTVTAEGAIDPAKRTIDLFKAIKPGMSMQNVFKMLGPPDKDVGSGIHIYVYKLRDGTEMWIGAVENVLYVSHCSKDESSKSLSR